MRHRQYAITARRQWFMRHHLLCITVHHQFIIVRSLVLILDMTAAVTGTMTGMIGAVANGVAGMTVDGVNRYIKQ
jgi:uncharacterized oligopeptide transporter (OPT) family protein